MRFTNPSRLPRYFLYYLNNLHNLHVYKNKNRIFKFFSYYFITWKHWLLEYFVSGGDGVNKLYLNVNIGHATHWACCRADRELHRAWMKISSSITLPIFQWLIRNLFEWANTRRAQPVPQDTQDEVHGYKGRVEERTTNCYWKTYAGRLKEANMRKCENIKMMSVIILWIYVIKTRRAKVMYQRLHPQN